MILTNNSNSFSSNNNARNGSSICTITSNNNNNNNDNNNLNNNNHNDNDNQNNNNKNNINNTNVEHVGTSSHLEQQQQQVVTPQWRLCMNESCSSVLVDRVAREHCPLKLCERCCFYICTGKHCECGAATNAAQPPLMCNMCSWMMRCACGRICTQFCATMCCRLCCKDWDCQVHIAYNNVNKNTVKGFDSSIPDSTLSILLNYQSENVSNESLNKNLLEDLFL